MKPAPSSSRSLRLARVLRETSIAARLLLVSAAACAAPAPPVEAPAASRPAPPAARPDDPIEIAVTVDDLPHHGEDTPGVTRLAIHERLIAAFARHHVPSVVGFVNARTLEAHAEEEAALRAWVAAGHPLANHTYGHVDASQVSAEELLDDIARNEPVLARLMAPRPEAAWKIFRYPYLREGKDHASQLALRAEIARRGYRFAPVTVDTYDWAYAMAYTRCRAKDDAGAIEALREDFIDNAAAELRWADGAGRELYGRPVRQILLLHAADFTATLIDDLLTTYEKGGARFITLDEALRDPIYATEPDPRAMPLGNHLWRARKARGTRSPSIAPPRDTLLAVICR